jgi:Fe-S-cluster containining protein
MERESMNKIELPVLQPQQSARTEFGFERVICDCPECTVNCKHIPGYLVPSDVARIAKHLGYGEDLNGLIEFAAANLLASPGATVGCSETGEVGQIPTLVPGRRRDGACKFLDGNDHCTIHEVSPYACAFFGHQSDDDADRRSLTGLHAVMRDWKHSEVYSLLWLLLNEIGQTAPSAMVARAQMKAAIAVAKNAA